MHPHASILIFTTLAGLAQGFFVALLAVEWFAPAAWTAGTLAAAAWTVLALLVAGLAASVFHLGRPERAWRAASQWRNSWLSREVIVLPALTAAVCVHALALQLGGTTAGAWVAGSAFAGALLCAALWWCTGMIYACLKMLREWATPLTPLSFAALGLASGAGAAGAWFACLAGADTADARPTLAGLAFGAFLLTGLAGAVKAAWWQRRAQLQPRSTLQSALGIGHPQIRQLSMGMTGGTFNTREFFHGQGAALMRRLPLAMVGLGTLLPLLAYGVAAPSAGRAEGACLMCAGIASQVAGILVERWLFFAWARHPQNLYYQRVS